MSKWSAKSPYQSKVTECYVLNGPGSKKETCHIVFDLGDSGMDYKVGDALGVLAENPPHTVDELIEVTGWDSKQIVSTHNGERTLRDALKMDFEIHRVNKKFVNSLVQKVTSTGMRITVSLVERYREAVAGGGSEWMGGDSSLVVEPNPSIPGDDPVAKVANLVSDGDAMEDYIWSRDYIDVIRDFDVQYDAEEFLELIDKLKPRLYSIASSHDAHPGSIFSSR